MPEVANTATHTNDMVIAVDTRILLEEYLDRRGYFLYESLLRITRNNPQQRFIFIFDKTWDPKILFNNNVIPVRISPAPKNPLLLKWWYDYRIPAILRKYKANVFVSSDRCSRRTGIPQCIIVHSINTPKFLSIAKRVITVSSFLKKEIVATFKLAHNKIDVAFPGVRSGFRPVDLARKREIKNKYTDDKEFFLYVGTIDPRKNLVNLLKAFSLFKTRLKSGMKLVLAGRVGRNYQTFIDNLKSYKYRDDVIVTRYVEEPELNAIMAAAYALVDPSASSVPGMTVFEAMRCKVPVIICTHAAEETIGEEVALFADASDPRSIAEQMMLIYKDEKFRERLILKAEILSMEYDWDKTSEVLWESISKATSDSRVVVN